MSHLSVDALIVGGGIAGLWTLDAVLASGRTAMLVESGALGGGQTVASQGILHSGLKYSLAGVLTAAAREASEMPALWRRCLSGDLEPDLRRARVKSQSFYLWGTQSASSRIGMLGAQFGLKVTPKAVTGWQRPGLLHRCAGAVFRVDEQVLCPASLVSALAERHDNHIIQIASHAGLAFDLAAPGTVRRATLHSPGRDRSLAVEPAQVVLTAGAGNAELRCAVGLDARAMQRRPLHYVLVRGRLPEFHGHCVDFNKTRVSITSACDRQGRTVWQIGGQISEDGVAMDSASLIQHTFGELEAVLPDLDLSQTEWTTRRIDRAEGATATGLRPDSYKLLQEGNVITAWPTKLVLAPQLAAAIARRVLRAGAPAVDPPSLPGIIEDWPRPPVAQAAWEESGDWMPAPLARPQRRAA